MPPSSDRRAFSLRIRPPARDEQISLDPDRFRVYQILPMPVDVNRAGYVRHTGLSGDRTTMPRALLPVTADRGIINLSSLRNPADPLNPSSRFLGSGQPAMIWVDIRIPPETPPGDFRFAVELNDTRTSAISSVPVRLTVHDFVLPDERHLVLCGLIDWSALTRNFPDRFESVRPMRLGRGLPEFARTIDTLDKLVLLAQEHRLVVNFSRLQPVVKWPAGKPPEINWSAYDQLVAPWLRGEGFADKVPLGFWLIPTPDFFNTYDP
ncbi:MAG: hypothetical protein NZ561_02375, partial [Phycisphaerae bacterium]|nr:hypothetical protein [Phycisphaerae bacterium]